MPGILQIDYLIHTLWDIEAVQERYRCGPDEWVCWYEGLKNITDGQRRRFWALIYKERINELLRYLNQFDLPKVDKINKKSPQNGNFILRG